MSDNKNKVKGCVHQEDACGDYADNNGCRGPREKVDLSSVVITNKTTTNWVYRVVLDLEKLVSNHISLQNSYYFDEWVGDKIVEYLFEKDNYRERDYEIFLKRKGVI